jgi:glutathione peroxidase
MNIYELSAQTLDGKQKRLADFRGKVVLIVNVASECGYTPQYAGLQALQERLAARGLVVLGFPSNEFGGQEPGSAEEIQSFCSTRYAVTFPLFAKIETKMGPHQAPLYTALAEATGKLPAWNFSKYVVGRDGTVREFFDSGVKPDDPKLLSTITTALEES